jgi:hypothetical protein
VQGVTGTQAFVTAHMTQRSTGGINLDLLVMDVLDEAEEIILLEGHTADLKIQGGIREFITLHKSNEIA